jgi:dolichyl-phosphate beta-glucosyltransferase
MTENTVHSIRLSVVIPAFNEENRIATTLDTLLNYFAAQSYEGEIIVVDDGSTDQTGAVVESYAPQVTLLRYDKNRGKGYAMRRGVPQCHGQFRLVYDADGSTPIEDIEKVWPLHDAGADIVIGSRALPESNVALRQPLYRQSMGRIYNVLLRLLFLTPFKDTQCGFKSISAACADEVFPKLTTDGFGMDCEMLFVASKKGYTIAEVPVTWINSLESKVNAFWHSLDMIREVIGIRLKSIAGRYR